MRPIRIGRAMRIEIGYDGENGAREIVFDATQWMKELPGCTAAITAERADGEKYIAPNVTQDEGKKTITWTLTSAETMEGEGRAQLLWMDGERIAKQAIFTTVCHESLKSDATEIGVPEPVWAQKSFAAAQEAKESAQAAAASAESAKNALEATRDVRDAAKQEIDGKKETAIAGIENAKTEAIVAIQAEKEELAPPIISEAEGTKIAVYDSEDRTLRGLTVYGRTKQDGTPTGDAPVVLKSVGDAGSVKLTIRNVAESGDAADDTQIAAISTEEGLRGVPAMSGAGTYTDADGQGWIADTIEYEAQTGTARIVRRVARVTYDGSADEEWGVTYGYNALCVSIANAARISHGLCTHFEGMDIANDQNAIGFSAAASDGLIAFRPNDYAHLILDIDAWRAKLNASPVTVIYALAVPEITPITGDELAALTALRSRYPAMTVLNNALAHMAVRYIADTKTYVDDANAELANAILTVDGRVDTAMEQAAGVGEIADAAREKADENEIKIGELKENISEFDQDHKKFEKVYKPFEYPSEFTGTFRPVSIFTDGENYITDFARENFMNKGGSDIYACPISAGGTSSNSGTKDSPYNFYTAMKKALDGDTVYLLSGEYTSNDLGALIQNYSNLFWKSINIIGEGDVRLLFGGAVFGNMPSKIYDSDQGLWKCTRKGTMQVVDASLKFRWKKVSDIDTCKATGKSWCNVDSTVYINNCGEKEPNVYIFQDGFGIKITPEKEISIYFENIKFIGGTYNVYVTNPTKDAQGITVSTWNNCKFLFERGNYNGFRMCGGHSLCMDCEASHAYLDGFGYTNGSADVELQFVEIGCTGANNGVETNATTDNVNGSTCHTGVRGIRVNGNYYNNYGANVADVHDGTMTINLGCKAFDSCGTSRNEGFSAQQSGATMWLYHCKAYGNDKDVECVNGSTMHIIDSKFDKYDSSGTLTLQGEQFIAENADLDSYRKSGNYRCRSAGVAGTLLNSPVTNEPFVLEIKEMMGMYPIQVIYTEGAIYMRRGGYVNNSIGWRSWYKFNGAVMG